MNVPPIPVTFHPIFKPKPWGGRALAQRLNKDLPAHEPIGESWELVSLPGNESRVRGGPLAEKTVSDLIAMWGRGLHGDIELADGHFPLLIKFLDAHEHLSVQVHPKPPEDDPLGWRPGIKHEAWYVVHAEPGAEIFVGLKPGVTRADVERAANTPQMADLLRHWPVKPGQCFYLPSGTLHALGAGTLVAEVQTPSDVTYRLYDWDRLDDQGRPRQLHIDDGLQNIRYDVAEQEIVQPRRHVAGPFATVTHLTACERFLIDKVRLTEGLTQDLPSAEMTVWMVLAGGGRFNRSSYSCPFCLGDVVLIPADCRGTRLEVIEDCEILEVKIPIRSSLRGLERPAREPAPQARRESTVALTRAGRRADS